MYYTQTVCYILGIMFCRREIRDQFTCVTNFQTISRPKR